jgi:putative DNA primase/helicase
LQYDKKTLWSEITKISGIRQSTADDQENGSGTAEEPENDTSGQADPDEDTISVVTSAPLAATTALSITELDCPELQSDTKGSQLPERYYNLDNAQPLDSSKFPNQPRIGSNQLPSTIGNTAYLLSQYGITVRYNVIKKKLMITLPGHTGSIDNLDNVSMTKIISLATQNGLSYSQIPAYVEAIADQNMFNPVADWINSKPWDGKDRLADICETVTERDDYPVHLKNTLICKWLLSAVAAALVPNGFRARGVLTFQGPQGIGKTSWLMSLVDDPLLRDMAVKIDHHHDGGKDSVLGAISHWLVEFGELDSTFKKDIARLKGFLTSNFDKIRRPYARTEAEYQRRTVFFASVNQPDFLVDSTGNTRWWTIPVTAVDFKHGIDIQQVFAQLAVDLQQGRQWWLTADEEKLLDACNKDHLSISVIRERLMQLVDSDLADQGGHPAMTPSEVLGKIGYDRPTNPQCRECGSILRELFGEPKKIKGIYRWRVPLKPTTLHH